MKMPLFRAKELVVMIEKTQIKTVLCDARLVDELLAKELQDFVKKTIAPFKYPRALDFVDSLPKTETGKIQRFKLRQV